MNAKDLLNKTASVFASCKTLEQRNSAEKFYELAHKKTGHKMDEEDWIDLRKDLGLLLVTSIAIAYLALYCIVIILRQYFNL